jgi:hypothetical protein
MFSYKAKEQPNHPETYFSPYPNFYDPIDNVPRKLFSVSLAFPDVA